jgi:hypothetical protein
MQRGGQEAGGAEVVPSTGRVEEVVSIVNGEAIEQPERAKEVEGRRAAAHQDVLASVECHAGRPIDKRGNASSKSAGRFEQLDVPIAARLGFRVGQRYRRSQPGRSAAEDRDFLSTV